MTSHPSNTLSDLKNLLAVNVNYSNSISRIFQNEIGVELFTKRNESCDIQIAPFETNQIVEKSKSRGSKENKENFLRKKRSFGGNSEMEKYNSATSVNRFQNNFGTSNPNLKQFLCSSTVKEEENEFTSSSSRNLISDIIESSFGGSKADPRWTKREEISFIAMCLIHIVSSGNIKLVDLLNFIPSRTKKQFYRHYYGNKSNIKNFSDIFLEFYKLQKEVNLKKNSNQILEMFGFISKNLFDKGFIKYFNEKVDDEKCQKYFENIHAYITFEPRAYIKPPKSERDFYNSPLPKIFSSKRNSSKEIFKNSNINKSSSVRILSSFKLEEELSVSNLTFKIEEKLFNKLCAISSSEDLIFDDSFLLEYALKEF